MKYKVGDKVVIRKDLSVDYGYSNISFVESMKKFRGTIQTIARVDPHEMYYEVEGDTDHWCFSDDMFTINVDTYSEEEVINIIGNYLLYHEQKCILADLDHPSTYPISVREWFEANKK